MFCPEQQKILQPIYNLTRRCRQFIWGKEQQAALEEIKCRLISQPVLHLPNSTGRFHLYSDTSKFAMESTLYQIQNGKPKTNSICQQKITKSIKKLFHNRVRTVWFSYKYS